MTKNQPRRFGTYKFLRSQDVEKMLAGSIIMRPLRYFIALETTDGPWIGDAMEGSVMALFPGENDAKTVEHLTPAGSRPFISGAKDTKIVDCVIHYKTREDLYIWCVSVGEFSELQGKMCSRSATNPTQYDACVEVISGLQPFAAHIIKNGVAGMFKVSDLFSHCASDVVRYDDVRKKPGQGIAQPGPFLKDKLFESQREARLVGTPRGDVGNRLVVKFPNPSQFLKRVM